MTVELYYGTYGSFGQFHRDIAILVDGSVIDPELAGRYMRRGEETTRKVTVNGKEYTITISDVSSRKNRHVKVYVPREIVKAVLTEGASASKYYPLEVTQGEGDVVAEDNEETRENGRYRYIKTVRTWYYVHGNMKIPIKRREVDFRKELIGKPQVSLYVEDNRVIAKGDTYQCKDVLKRLKMRWDTLSRCWVGEVDVEEVKKALKNAGVEVSVNSL